MPKLARPFVAAVAALCIVVAGQSFAAATPQLTEPERVAETYVDSSGVVHYTFDPASLPGASVVRETGVVRGDECVFSTSDEIGRNVQVRILREIDYEHARCSRTVAVAEYEHDKLPDVVIARLQAKGISLPSEPAAAPLLGWRFIQDVEVQDPVNVAVNRTNMTRKWFPNGTYSGSGSTWHLTTTGWTRTAYNNSNTATTSTTTATFKNDPFCVGQPTTVVSHTNRVTTSSSGSYTPFRQVSKSGGCSSWLHEEVTQVHGPAYS